MNLVTTCNKAAEKLRSILQRAYFTFIQKPLYLLSYNQGGNAFVCHGRLYHSTILLEGSGCRVEIGKNCVIKNTTIRVSGRNNRLIIGDGVIFAEGGTIKLEDEGNTISIGRGTSIINAFIAASDYNTEITFGERCMVSNQVVVRNSDVHSILNTDGQRINHGRSTHIGNHVWLGYGATVLKGATIGAGSIVGSQAVVPGREFPEGVVIAGNPAKVVKEGVNWCGERLKPNTEYEQV